MCFYTLYNIPPVVKHYAIYYNKTLHVRHVLYLHLFCVPQDCRLQLNVAVLLKVVDNGPPIPWLKILLWALGAPGRINQTCGVQSHIAKCD